MSNGKASARNWIAIGLAAAGLAALVWMDRAQQDETPGSRPEATAAPATPVSTERNPQPAAGPGADGPPRSFPESGAM